MYKEIDSCNEEVFVYVRSPTSNYFIGYCQYCITKYTYSNKDHIFAKDLDKRTIKI